MELATYEVPCGDCGARTKVQINLFNGEHKVLKAEKVTTWSFAQKLSVVEHYKALKGFTKENFPSWDKLYRARAFKATNQILDVFSAMRDPADLAVECIDDIAFEAKKGGWHWTLETIVKRAPEWLVAKQRGGRR